MQQTGVVSILVVEDESIVALDLSRTLNRLGYAICGVCYNATSAFQKAAASFPNLALVDITLHDPEDGIDLAHRLRHELDIPVVFLTANVDAQVIQRALASDAFGYLVKPYNEHMLHATIELALRRFEALKRLKNSEERYRTLFHSMSLGVTIRNREGRVLDLNPAAVRIFGLDAGELTGSRSVDHFDTFDPAGNPIPPDRYPTAIIVRSGKPIEDYIMQVRERTSGRTRWHKINAYPLFKPGDPVPVQVISIFEDVTDKRITEQALLESERKYRLLAENAADVIWQLDIATMRMVYVSPSIFNLRGLTVEEALNENVEDSLDDDGREILRTELPRRLGKFQNGKTWDTTQSYIIRQRRKNGSWTWVEMVTTVLGDESGKARYILGVSRSIDERIRHQQEIQAERQRYQALFEQVVDAVIVNEYSADGGPGPILEANPAACQMLGWSREELLGLNVLHLSHFPLKPLSPDSPDPIVQQVLAGKDAYFEHELLRRDGTAFPADIFTRLVNYNGRNAALSVIRDISARKKAEAEIQQLNADLERRVSERTSELEHALKELETFAYSVSHDLKTPLRAIDGFSQILLEDYSNQLDGQGRDHLTRIRRATLRMGQLIDDLLAYSRLERRDLILGPVNLPRLVDQVLAEQNEEIARRGVDVRIDLQSPELIAEPQGLTQCLRNLVDNALKFSAAQPQPVLEIGSRRVEDRIRLWVRDNGIGFDMRYHDQIFDIFKRLHRGEEYPGTGVGLAIVRKAMQRVGGSVWAESAPGQGATFFLDFPT